MAKRHWKIVGVDGIEPFYEHAVPVGHLSERQACELLARLASRHLTEDEVVSASLGGRASGRDERLQVRRNNGGSYGLFTTGDPHYVARIEEGA